MILPITIVIFNSLQLQVFVGSTPTSSFLWPLCNIRQNQIQTEEFCVVRINSHFILDVSTVKETECEHKFIIYLYV